ncbi:MAG TPA: HEAT repeat domain-containing protein [Phycisphaerae bacterium]|nr:HEAT repeat domain-containing protein [Phycisphaerae bacterium]
MASFGQPQRQIMFGRIPFGHVLAVVLVCVASLAVPGSIALGEEGADQSEQIAQLYSDFLHYARIGKFAEAEANANKLLTEENIDPVQLMRLADADSESIPTLLTLIRHTSMRDTAQKILDLIREGEFRERQDETRIINNIDNLSGTPQMEYNAISRLRESGEYAVPEMIAALKDVSKENSWPRVIRALPKIGRDAVGPLVMALGDSDPNVRRNVAWALGELGYPQATPYLLKVMDASDTLPETRQNIVEALQKIERTSDRSQLLNLADSFIRLANDYYNEEGSVKADPRVPLANVWYLDEGTLVSKKVPTEIFGSVMAMRACEEALMVDPGNQLAISLWLAANIRREARLGMDVESAEADAGSDADPTHADDFPRSLYFSQAAGPMYCHLVLGRAVADNDKSVALGAIAALDVVAGSTSLIGTEDYKQPLVQSLRFPDAEVRIKAAIALARALPKSPFAGSDLVGPTLAEALRLGGTTQIALVDADSSNLNRLAGEFRSGGADAAAESNLAASLDRARRDFQFIAGIVLSTNMTSPKLSEAVDMIRKEYRFARTPIVILSHPNEEYRAQEAAVGREMVETIEANAGSAEILKKIEDMLADNGSAMGGPQDASLALRAAEALRLVAIDGRTVIDIRPAIPALIGALAEEDESLRIRSAEVLALTSSANGQRSICETALDAENAPAVRIAMFNALAEAAKRQGNDLETDQVQRLVKQAMDSSDLTLRTAASQALGALNLDVSEASEIIRNQHKG